MTLRVIWTTPFPVGRDQADDDTYENHQDDNRAGHEPLSQLPCTPRTIPKNVGGRCRPWPMTAKTMVSFRPMMLNAHRGDLAAARRGTHQAIAPTP